MSCPESFDLKYRDTRPILEVALKNPDGSAFDLTGATVWKLHIWLSNGDKLSRDMVVTGAATLGILRYTWLSSDWNAGGLIVGEHKMEYEIIAATARQTFPNDGYDLLRIISDVGQGT